MDIIGAASLSLSDVVVEIGPGKGVLTEALLKNAGRVIAVEKDDRLIDYLKEKFSSEIRSGKLNLVHGDILEFNLAPYTLYPIPYVLVANIPYYITGLIMRKFLEGEIPPTKIVLMVQKEVAERIVVRDKKESILSISVKIFGRPKLVKKISASCFSPRPKVDSAILLIENISSPFKNPAEKKKFFEILKKGFSHKRKLLLGNLSKLLPKEKIVETFKKCDINEKSRAENLGVKEWRCLSDNL